MTDVPFELPSTRGRDFLAKIPAYKDHLDYLGPLLHGGHRVTVAGKMGEGKTSLLMEMASAVVLGTDFLGFKGAGAQVGYINLEMGDEQIGQAMRDARLDQDDHDRFHLLNFPDGLAIDEVSTRGDRDRKLIRECIATFPVVILDPWYQLLAAELPESNIVGRIIRYLQAVQKAHPATCMVFGKHLQEQSQKSSTGNISGFKAFERNADLILGMERIGGSNVSRIRFLKSRSPRLGVKMGERWMVEWERGRGFTRTDQKNTTEQVLELVGDEWQLVDDIAETWGRDRSQVSRVLNVLEAEGKVESMSAPADGRGRPPKLWRRAYENQGVLSAAA